MPDDSEQINPDQRQRSLSEDEMIEHYRIIKNMAVGGMGEIYLAFDTKLHRNIVLKILAPKFSSNRDVIEMFTNEGLTIASVNHPNIVTIHEVGLYKNLPFIVMEHIDGHSLRELIDSGTITEMEGIRYIKQICCGLEAIYHAGIIHNDLKPENIIITKSGEVKLIDFGLAESKKTLRTESFDYKSGSVFYLSPERINNDEISFKSDFFSLGIILYEMFTGVKPFDGDYEAAVFYSIVNDKPKPIEECNPDLDNDLVVLINNLLSKKPTDRFDSTDDILKALKVEKSAEASKSKPKSKVTYLPYVLAIVVFIAVFMNNWIDSDTATAHDKTLAILPFQNLGQTSDNYFSDGITDAIATRLKKISSLKIIARSSTIQYKDNNYDPALVGRELGVSYLLTGSIFLDKNTDSVIINSQLIDIHDNSLLWAEEYRDLTSNIFQAYSKIAHNVSTSLKIALTTSDIQQLNEIPTDNLEAYDYYLKGNEAFYRSWYEPDLQEAINMYQEAIILDPDFAAAYARLSLCYSSMYWENYDMSISRCQTSLDFANKAISLQNDLTQGYLALGYYYYRCFQDLDRALSSLEEGLSKEPNNYDLINAVAVIQRRKKLIPESTANFLKALELDPKSHLKAFDISLNYGFMNQYNEALFYLERTISLYPEWDLPHIYKAWLPIVRFGDTLAAYQSLNNSKKAINLSQSKYYWWILRMVESDYDKIFESIACGQDPSEYFIYKAQIYRLMNDKQNERIYSDSARILLETKLENKFEASHIHSKLALAYAGLDNKEKAIYHNQKAMELISVTEDVFEAFFIMENTAEVFTILNEYEPATDILERLLKNEGFISIPYLKIDPIWKPLMSFQRFYDLVNSTDPDQS